MTNWPIAMLPHTENLRPRKSRAKIVITLAAISSRPLSSIMIWYIIVILYYYLLYLAFGKIKGAAEFSMIIDIFGIRYHQRARRIWWSHCWSWWRWSSKSKHNISIIKKFVERFPPKHVNSVKLPPDNDVEMQVSRDEGAWVQRESVIDEAVGEEQVVPVKQLSYNIHVKWPFVNYLCLKQAFIFGL